MIQPSYILFATRFYRCTFAKYAALTFPINTEGSVVFCCELFCFAVRFSTNETEIKDVSDDFEIVRAPTYYEILNLKLKFTCKLFSIDLNFDILFFDSSASKLFFKI